MKIKKASLFDFVNKMKKKGQLSYTNQKNSCSPVDLRDQLGVVRDQDSI